LFKQDVSQVVQSFPELHGINQRMAVDVIPVMFVKIAAGK
jgi:hypothetical protein